MFSEKKKASFDSFIDRDWLDKVVVTLFKKNSNGIDVLGIFFAKDGPISTKYLLNSLAISSSPVFILSPILSFLGKFDFLLSIYTIYRFFNSSPFLCHVWIGVSFVSSDFFGLFLWGNGKIILVEHCKTWKTAMCTYQLKNTWNG